MRPLDGLVSLHGGFRKSKNTCPRRAGLNLRVISNVLRRCDKSTSGQAGKPPLAGEMTFRLAHGHRRGLRANDGTITELTLRASDLALTSQHAKRNIPGLKSEVDGKGGERWKPIIWRLGAVRGVRACRKNHNLTPIKECLSSRGAAVALRLPIGGLACPGASGGATMAPPKWLMNSGA